MVRRRILRLGKNLLNRLNLFRLLRGIGICSSFCETNGVKVWQRSAEQMAVFDRWVLLKTVLNDHPRRVIHFLHIPKTGGTTIASALGSDSRFAVISMDTSSEVFQYQLAQLSDLDQKKIVIIRGHHAFSLLEDSGVVEDVHLSFSTIRDPAEIQASNVNMILRRVAAFLGQERQNREEAEYAKRWLLAMGGRFEPTAEFALEILASTAYLREMGQVYSKFLGGSGWEKALASGRYVCIEREDVDFLLGECFGYSSTPARKNVTYGGPISAEMIPQELKRDLIRNDYRIFDQLRRNALDRRRIRQTFAPLLARTSSS